MPESVDPNRLKLVGESGDEGVLLGMRCRDCGVYMFGAASFCQACASAGLEAVELSKRGTLYSYTIVRVPPAGWPGPVPYTLGQVELPEGPHVLAEIIDCANEDLKIGMGVTLALQAVPKSDGGSSVLMVYKFRPVAGGA